MANYTNEIQTMMEKVLTIMLEYERKEFNLVSLGVAVTMREWMLLKYIEKHEKVSIAQLADAFKMDRGTMATHLNKCLKNHLLTKRRSDEDKRSFELELTEVGKKVYEEMESREAQMLDFLLKEVTINEEKGILKFLSKITQLTVSKYRIED